jgi:hypothetical protein
MKSLGDWSYNSASDGSSYYKMNKNDVKNEYFNVEIEENNKGVNYLHVNKSNTDERVHVFIAKGWLTSIKYWLLKYLSKNWTEVELCKQDKNNPQKITLLIDNKNLMSNKESTKTIISVFDFALRSKIKELEQVPARPIELADWLVQQKKTEARLEEKAAISTKWGFSPLIQELFLKQLESDFETEQIENEARSKIETFADWYAKNQYISLTNQNPLSDEFHKEIIKKLLEVIVKVNSLPEGFEEIGLKIKKEFISKISENFLGAFREKTQGWERLTKKEPFEQCAKNILFYAVSDFSSYGKDLKLVADELSWRWKLVSSSFS